jgi:DNA-binding XRE family transcriptional regulator
MVKVYGQTYAVKAGIVQITPDQLEDLIDEIALEQAIQAGGEYLPGEVVDRIVFSKENPVLVYREHRGLTQDKLAQKAKVSQATIAEIETGRKKGSIKTLKAIADALGVPLDDLV